MLGRGGVMRRFTLVELAVVLACILTLVALALPQTREAQLQARIAELEVDGAGLQQAVVAYVHAFDRDPASGALSAWQPVDPVPPAALGKTLQAWPATLSAEWESLDHRPDGDTRCAY